MESIKIFYKACPDINPAIFGELGGVIIDVRTREEFLGGHVEDSVNIPLDELRDHLTRLPNKGQPIIVCCSSGMQSAAATAMLESWGYTRVCNGGSWKNLQEKIHHGTTSV